MKSIPCITAGVLSGLAAIHKDLRAVTLRRNLGRRAAVSVGLRHERGRAIAGTDADPQERPRVDFFARVNGGVRLVRPPDAAQIVVWGGQHDAVGWRE